METEKHNCLNFGLYTLVISHHSAGTEAVDANVYRTARMAEYGCRETVVFCFISLYQELNQGNNVRAIQKNQYRGATKN